MKHKEKEDRKKKGKGKEEREREREQVVLAWAKWGNRLQPLLVSQLRNCVVADFGRKMHLNFLAAGLVLSHLFQN